MKFFIRNYKYPDGMEKAAQDLMKGESRHDVLESSIRLIEDNPQIDTVSYGGRPNLFGVMELDGAFMNGDGRQLGAVGSVTHYRHPVSIARHLMEEGVHTLLTGVEGELFAHEKGFEKEETLSPERRDEWETKIKPQLARQAHMHLELVRRISKRLEANTFDSVFMIASDGLGLSVATSSSGWDYKHPGRVGDAPIAGAGFYVDSRYGGCACTHSGEMSMRAGTARYVVTQMENGASPKEAALKGVEDLAGLSSGYLGPLVIHAVNKDGDCYVAGANITDEVYYWYWNEHMAEPELRKADPFLIPQHKKK